MSPKQQAAIKAAEFVTDGMILGLGTGSTVQFFVDEVGRKLKEEDLQITGVTTSIFTLNQAQALGIKMLDIDEVDHVDLLVDGADEIDAKFNGIKGGGAALLMEKVVATYTNDYIWIVDESKMSEHLGSFKVPVEVVQYGSGQVFRIFENKGYKPTWRENEEGSKLLTDMKNFIIDLHIPVIDQPEALAEELDHIVGVVEHGLFNGMVKKVIIGSESGTRILEK